MKKKLQFINYFPEWRGIKFFKVKIDNTNAAIFVCYNWIIDLGFWEIRKWRKNEITQEEINKLNK